MTTDHEQTMRGMAEGVLSDEDLNRYFDAVKDALAVYIDRDRIRQGLWKQYGELDQARQIKIKAERVVSLLEKHYEVAEENMPPEIEKEIQAEFDDIINYAVFGKRCNRGEV
jgi:hypothetical protein